MQNKTLKLVTGSNMLKADSKLAENSSTGQVFLVGAGPGDAELITVKGMRVLQKADAIV